MSIRKVERRFAPTDGTMFRTLAHLDSIIRCEVGYDHDYAVPEFVKSTWVPVIVRMELYKAQETKENPSGMMFGPIVMVGCETSPEIKLFGHHYAAGLTTDRQVDEKHDGRSPDRWIYNVLPGDSDAPGEDASYYLCDKCNKQLYRDEPGRRNNHSACLFNDELVCRDCDFIGLVYDTEGGEQIDRAVKLATFIGDDCRQSLARHLDQLRRGFSFGSPCQTRLYREDRFSFGWGTKVFCEDGTTRAGMHGGLIQHGPHVEIDGDGAYSFSLWDHALKAQRDATVEEIGQVSWSIHT
jgi:hypothetical protein